MQKKKTRIIAALIAIALAAVMILSLVAATVHADTPDAEAAEETTQSDSAENAPEDGASGAAEAEAPKPAEKAGIYIENICVTDMNEQQIRSALQEKMAELSECRVNLYAGSESVTTTAGELGLTYVNENVVEEALSIGRSGNVLKRFLADRYLTEEGPVVLDLDFAVDPARVAEVVSQKKQLLDTDPHPTGLHRNADATFSVTPCRDGVAVKEAESVDKIVSYMDGEWRGGEGGVTLKALITPAEDTTQQLREVRDVLGSGSTSYDADNEDRDINISLAASKIDGIVLYPGEELSVAEAIGPTTEEAGFRPGSTFSAGEIIDTYGGGVCQVSTTLYIAILQAELEVTQRFNHSMLIGYVDPGFDAAISEDTLDLKFRNNLEYPIYIESYTKGGKVYANIYGKETRSPNRRIEFRSEILETEDYDTEYRTDSSLYLGNIVASSAQMGLTCELWKTVYINDEVDSEELVNTSKYDPMPLTYRVGIDGASAATVSAIKAAVATGDMAAIQLAVGTGTIEVSNDDVDDWIDAYTYAGY